MKKAKKKKAQAAVNIEIGVCTNKLKELKVTQRHINESEQGDTEKCAIAYCLREALGEDGEDADIDVCGKDVSFTITKEVTIPVVVCGVKDEIVKSVTITGNMDLGAKASKFIADFDEDRDSVKPTTFKAKPEMTVNLDSY